MLSRLTIENIALIKRVELEFSPELNILSGETGAGKSVIVDGLTLLLGGRYDKTLLRYGESSGMVEGVFDVTPAVMPKLTELGLDGDDILIVTRRFSADGRNEIRVNGRQVAASMLRELVARLVDIYGQNEYQTLSDKTEHLKLLDYFIRASISELTAEIDEAYSAYRGVVKELKALGDVGEREKNIDILKYQIEEIKSAGVKRGEEDALKERRKLIASAERIRNALGAAADCLTESGETEPASSLIGTALRALGNISDVSDEYLELYDRLKSVSIELEDISETAVDALERMNFDEREIDRLEQRYDLIAALKRKYGDYDKMTAYLSEAEERLYKLENSDKLYEKLLSDKKELADRLYGLCVGLSEKRRAGAIEFSRLIERELNELGMENSRFEVRFSDMPERQAAEDAMTRNGFDSVEFYFSPNVGHPLKPLIKIISGGEMSRFMLALKVITSRTDDIPTLIFDEIDAGISGIVGQAVAKKLARISRSHQVLCVTHLAQIASMADRHYYIEKKVVSDSTVTEVVPLDRAAAIDEISRLSGSKNITETTRETAAEMKKWSDEYKKSLAQAPGQ